MKKLSEIITQPEGRRIEFKEVLPAHSDLNKTAVAFANDAGGEIYIGIKDDPREIIGLDESLLIKYEEQISSSIHDNCSPAIMPEIYFLRHEDKHILVVKIHKGSNPPYHIKSKGVKNGTYIRVGSLNRIADDSIISSLELISKNISYDSVPVLKKELDQISLEQFKKHFEEIIHEELNKTVLEKLNLLHTERGAQFPTHALILLSDDKLRSKMFPYAKIECARFKGTTPGDFIDQKTFDNPLSLQPDQAYQFVLRHISQGSEYEGVYRKDRWEYPVIALREVIRNAVIHRDYSFIGKDIKIAIFDDKIEITSPGKLLPSVDFNNPDAGQSDIRNAILAPVFKKLGIIEQWGNGLKLIAGDLNNYPEIQMQWSEPGIAFRVSFIKKNFAEQQESEKSSENRPNTGRIPAESGSRPAEPSLKPSEKENAKIDLSDLTKQDKILLEFIKLHKQFVLKEIEKFLDVRESRAREIMRKMTKRNIVRKIQQGKNTYYVSAI